MRLFIMLVLVVSVFSSSCEKYRLKQPAYLGFHWSFTDAGSSKVKITSGFFYLDQLRVHGVRDAGPDVDIDQAFPLHQVSFATEGDLGLSMDIPVGDYNEFNVELSIEDQTKPCLVLYGEYNDGSNITPVRIEWSINQLLSFSSASPFSLEKKKNYSIYLGVEVQQLLGSISDEQWSQANITIEEGVPTLIIRDNNNHPFFAQIMHNLAASLKLTVQ